MECTQTQWLSDEAYLKQLHQKVTAQRIPLSGSLELTRRCNLKCVHCYLGGPEEKQDGFNPELNTAQWIGIIDQITEAGCLHLLITGGEPLLRKDFAEIYTHAKTNGLVVTLFTNGTLIDVGVLELFEDLPPHDVEISLYGATPETYEKITGVKGSFAKCIDNVKRLLDHNITLRLKTILMTHNHHEFDAIQQMAEEFRVKFRFDAAIFPAFGGDQTPVRLRVDPKEAIEMELSDKKRLKQLQDFFFKMKDIQVPDSLYNCSAGLTAFHIDAYGNLQPCLMVNSITYSLLKGRFMQGWQGTIPGIRRKKIKDDFACNQCEKMVLCGYCPAFFELETGAEDIPSEYLCAMGQHRFQAIDSRTV